VVALLAVTVAPAVDRATADDQGWPWPLRPDPDLVAGFDAPDGDYGPGHRGIDVRGTPGQPVTSATAGEVTVAAPIAGRGVVVVRTGELRITYEPVSAAVRVGEQVAVGALLGRLQQRGSHCWPTACLHLGVRDLDEYVDPLPRFWPRPVRLKPLHRTTLSGPGPAAGELASVGTMAAPEADDNPVSARRLVVGATVGGTAAMIAAGAARRRVRPGDEPAGMPRGGGRR
jgi:murein DD-endopeptidase MepM/ murein hydrolase activator NlpD